MQSTGVTYQWYSENNSYATVTSSTRYNATVKGIKATSSCKVYFKCSYFIDGFYRTMDFLLYDHRKIDKCQCDKCNTEPIVHQYERRKYLPTVGLCLSYKCNEQECKLVKQQYICGYGEQRTCVGKVCGTATITCRAADGSGKYATCKVSVESATVYVTSITLNKTSASLYVGETTQLNAAVSPSSATNKSVSWTSR